MANSKIIEGKQKVYLGIDPGWSSFGYSLIKVGGGNLGEVLNKGSKVPKEDKSMTGFIKGLDEDLDLYGWAPNLAFIERFVAYENIHSTVNEPILMLIGGLKYRLEHDYTSVRMVRAIDWKSQLCKYLVRNLGFSNPFGSFDKKFSLLAANTILENYFEGGEKITVDHEADAFCLSFMGVVEEYDRNRKAGKRS